MTTRTFTPDIIWKCLPPPLDFPEWVRDLVRTATFSYGVAVEFDGYLLSLKLNHRHRDKDGKSKDGFYANARLNAEDCGTPLSIRRVLDNLMLGFSKVIHEAL